MSLFTIAITFFFIANPVGNSPAIIAMIKDFTFDRQRIIMFREAVLALLLAIFFQYGGELFLSQLDISLTAVKLCGGILLLLVALDMVLKPHSSSSDDTKALIKEPILVPIATPLISGPALLTFIMLYAKQESSNLKVTLAILLAWIAITTVMVSFPYLKKVLGSRGLTALEKLMGLLLAMMSTEMIVQGLQSFITRI